MTNSNQKIGVGNKQTKKYIFFRGQRYAINLNFTIFSQIHISAYEKLHKYMNLHFCHDLIEEDKSEHGRVFRVAVGQF